MKQQRRYLFNQQVDQAKFNIQISKKKISFIKISNKQWIRLFIYCLYHHKATQGQTIMKASQWINLFYKLDFFPQGSVEYKNDHIHLQQIVLFHNQDKFNQQNIKPYQFLLHSSLTFEMPRVQHRIMKDDFKKYQKNGLYKKQTNILISNENYDQSKRYLIQLNFLGDQSKSLIDVFLHFFESIHEIPITPTNQKLQTTFKYNRVFTFFLKLYFLHDKFLPKLIKITEEEVTALMDVVGTSKTSYLKSDDLRTNFKTYCGQIKQEIDLKFKKQLSSANIAETQSEQLVKYEVVQALCQSEKQKTIEQILSIKQSSIKQIYVPKDMQSLSRVYLEKILDIFISIKFTKKIYRSSKFSHFLSKAYKSYFKIEATEIQNLKDNWSYQKRFIVQRYTNNDKQYLIDVHNLTHLRKKNIKYQQQSFEICKQLLKELIKHQSTTKSTYPLLSPKAVIFNQLSLKTQLAYDNPLLSALGLLKKPVNIENMICFKATPDPYDSYATAKELENPDLLTNHLIGISRFFKENNQHHLHHSRNNQSLFDIHQIQAAKSQSWRFMMTVYFIINGQEYFKQVQAKRIEKFEDFLSFVQQQQSKLYNQSQPYYLKLMSNNFSKHLTRKSFPHKFEPNLSFFESLLREAQIEDEIIEQLGCIKIKRYLKTFILIFRQLIALVEHQKMTKIFNIVRYLLRFYFSVYLQLSQIYLLCLYCQKNMAIGLRLLEQYINQSQQSRNESKWIQSSYLKFKEYEDRNEKKRENQMLYLFDKYKTQYDQTPFYNDLINQINHDLQQLSPSSNHKGEPDLQSKIQIRKIIIASISEKIRSNLPNLKDIIHSIIFKQFLNHKEDPRVFIETIHYKNRLKLVVNMFLCLNGDIYLTIQSMILPILKLNENLSRKQINNERVKINYDQENELYQYCLSILKDHFVQKHQTNQSYIFKNCVQSPWKQHRNDV